MKNHLQAILACIIITSACVVTTHAQVASNGAYTLDASVIASGGGTSSDAATGGNTYTLDGSIGQSTLGTSRAGTRIIVGGFFAEPILGNNGTPASLLADTWVQGADAFRNTNFGTSPEMQVKRTLNPGSGRGRRGFLRFDTSNVTGNITSARLRIFARLSDASLPSTGMIIQKVADTTWGETTMTWNNQPPTESPNALAQITVTNADGQYYEFDLTSFIQAERAAGRTVLSFRLINQTATGNSGAFFTSVSSREGQNPPQLIIEQ